MNPLLKVYGVEGPLGFPMQERQARTLETLLKSLPKGKEHAYRRVMKAAATTELNPGERADVSWISTETPDHCHEVVIAKGMNDSQFALNPIVTLNHHYHASPVGRSLWRKRVKDGATVGIKAKTKYPEAPASWPQGEPWPTDKVFSLVQSQLLNGKSIGFLPLKVHFPDAKEASKNDWPTDTLVIDEWLLLEYAVCSMPMNPEAITEIVSKAGPFPEWIMKAIGIDIPVKSDPVAPFPAIIPYTSWAEVEKIITEHISGLNWNRIAEKAVESALDRMAGRV